MARHRKRTATQRSSIPLRSSRKDNTAGMARSRNQTPDVHAEIRQPAIPLSHDDVCRTNSERVETYTEEGKPLAEKYFSQVYKEERDEARNRLERYRKEYEELRVRVVMLENLALETYGQLAETEREVERNRSLQRLSNRQGSGAGPEWELEYRRDKMQKIRRALARQLQKANLPRIDKAAIDQRQSTKGVGRMA